MNWGNKDSGPLHWLYIALSLAVLALSYKQYTTNKLLEQTKQDLEECKSEKSRINFELDVRERRQLNRPEQDSMR
jgi:hypothetical protein